ncbi:MAG: helix-turn-helix domain-containing protein [Patescibacteria group bacterium]|nr:helix-turn-helix domain-containing protein [Patescibacteria group bacterium]
MIEQELQKFGLSQKEIKVYLSSLQSGPRSAQEISRVAGVNRVTCYVILESLKGYGLVTQVDGERGRLFAAENPANIIRFLESREREIQDVKARVHRAMPELMAIFNGLGDKPLIRFLDGIEGIEVIQREVFEKDVKNIDSIACLDAAFEHIDPYEFTEYRENMIAKKITGRTIYTSKKYTTEYLPDGYEKCQELRRLPFEKFNFPAEIWIADNFAAIFSFQGKPAVIAIEHPAIIAAMKTWFELAWEAAAHHAQQ